MRAVKIPKILVNLFPVFVFVLVTTVVFWPVFTAPDGQTLFGDDFFRSYSFFREFFRQEVRSGEIPFWNPYLFSGTPMLANPSVSYLYPLNFLYILLSVPDAWVVITVINLMIAFAGMFWLIRRVAGESRLAATFAAVAFAFSGYFMARIWAGHTEILSSAPYLPWVVGLAILMFRKQAAKSAVIFALVLSLQITAGYQTIAFFTLEACGVFALLYAISHRSLKPFLLLGMGTFLAVGLSAYELLPKLEYFRESIRTYAFGYDWAAYGSVRWDNFRQLIAPFILGDKTTYAGTPPNYPEQAFYAGALTLVMAVFGIALTGLGKVRKNMLIVSGLVVLLVFSLWVSLGINAPGNLHRLLWEILPTYRSMRIPPRHLILAAFAISVLGGMGLAHIPGQIIRKIILITLILEMTVFARQFIELKPVPGTSHDQELVRILSFDKELFRYLPNFGVWVPPRDALDFDAAMTQRIFSATGYDPSILKNYYAFADATLGNMEPSIKIHDVQIPYLDVFSPAIDFLNIKYLLVPPAYDPASWFPGVKYRLIKEDLVRGYRLYENTIPLPRFFLVGKADVRPDLEVTEVIRTAKADFAGTVYLVGPEKQQFAECPEGQVFPPVAVRTYQSNRIELEVEAPCPSYLVTSEAMYPGWQATVDGKVVPVKTANLTFRSVAVPAGSHTVVFRFVPYSLYLGILITIVSVTGAGIFIGCLRRKT